MNFKLYRLYIFIILCQAAVFGQEKEVISKERFDSLFDSLLTEKQFLLAERDRLNHDIDSLKNVISDLDKKLVSARMGGLVRKYGKDIGSRISQGQVWKGMTEKMLEESWGKPDKIDRNKEKWGVFTQWYYGDITYFFRDGVMTDWEEKK